MDVDFEYVRAQNREGYAEFVGELRAAMNEKGYRVSVALAPKTSSDQKGLLYEGIDYALLGEQADRLFLMTYEWGYSYGPPMAVAPLTKVRQVVEYALTQIPAEKLLMGIPNYGYNWTLPYEKGVTKAETIGNVGAVRLAVAYGAPIQYDQEAQSPYFIYRNQGREQEVWFEEWEQKTISAIQKAAFTGEVGDGKIFSYEIRSAVKIRTKETGYNAVQSQDNL